jgi:hypothetical protein
LRSRAKGQETRLLTAIIAGMEYQGWHGGIVQLGDTLIILKRCTDVLLAPLGCALAVVRPDGDP